MAEDTQIEMWKCKHMNSLSKHAEGHTWEGIGSRTMTVEARSAYKKLKHSWFEQSGGKQEDCGWVLGEKTVYNSLQKYLCNFNETFTLRITNVNAFYWNFMCKVVYNCEMKENGMCFCYILTNLCQLHRDWLSIFFFLSILVCSQLKLSQWLESVS